MTGLDSKINASTDYTCSDCSSFLNWQFSLKESESEKVVVFRSLVATVKIQPSLDVSLEAKAVEFLKSVNPYDDTSADAFITGLASISEEYLTDFVQSMMVLFSSPSQVITTATMKMLRTLIDWCSPKIRLALFKADLIPQLINTLNILSLSFTEAIDIHTCLMKTITRSLSLTTPDGLRYLRITDRNEQQSVHETVLQQVLTSSEKYICHLCLNRFSIIDGDQSWDFVDLLARLLRICPYYQSTMDFVLNMPSRSMVATLSFILLRRHSRTAPKEKSSILTIPRTTGPSEDDSEGSEDIVAQLMAGIDERIRDSVRKLFSRCPPCHVSAAPIPRIHISLNALSLSYALPDDSPSTDSKMKIPTNHDQGTELTLSKFWFHQTAHLCRDAGRRDDTRASPSAAVVDGWKEKEGEGIQTQIEQTEREDLDAVAVAHSFRSDQSIRTFSANLIHFLQLHSFLFLHLIQRCLRLVLLPTEENDDDDSEDQSDEEAHAERDQPAQKCLHFFGHRLLFWVFWFCVWGSSGSGFGSSGSSGGTSNDFGMWDENGSLTTTGMELLAEVRMTDLIANVVSCVRILSSPTTTNSSVSAVVAGDSTTTVNTASLPLSSTSMSYFMMCTDTDTGSGAMGVVNGICMMFVFVPSISLNQHPLSPFLQTDPPQHNLCCVDLFQSNELVPLVCVALGRTPFAPLETTTVPTLDTLDGSSNTTWTRRGPFDRSAALPLFPRLLDVSRPSSVPPDALPLPSASPLTTLGVACACGCSFEAHAMLASTVFLLRFL
ncbi:hypothetical protein BLNAU_10480 [Blattamonas nauphoetae]|uniref:Uncharacterized protein n=1 Tax=Blattamonas nauphoetae TaxID=2049346 RepID=A0ABQ9XS28_9EUKA|nr:hypothetical protein BLNAU_10480 [Blattamonas nauphoetae]